MNIDGVKILSIFVVALSGICGSCGPVLFAHCATQARVVSHRTLQLISKLMTCLSIGVIITTALVHVFSDGVVLLQESGGIFDDPSFRGNGTRQTHEEHDNHPYPFAALFVVITVCAVYFLSTEINWYGVRRLRDLTKHECDEDEEEELAAQVELHILVAGVAVHSVILGLTLGITSHLETARVLLIVLVLDCFFDALAIGNLINSSQVNFWFHGCIVVAIFAFSAPLGIGIGIGVKGNASLTAQGVLSCISAGLLLNMALVDMLPHALGTHSHHAHGPQHQHQHQQEKKQPKKAAPRNNNNNNTPKSDSKTPRHDDDDDGEVAVGAAAVDIVASNNKNVNDEDRDTSSTAATNEPTCSAAEESTTTIDAQCCHDKDDKASTTCSDDKNSIAAETDIVDHHELDDSFCVRLGCYVAILVGCAIQSAIRVWE